MKLATLRSSSTTMMRIALAALVRVSAVVASGEPAARRGGIRLERVGVAARQLHEADPDLAVAYHYGQQRGRGPLRDSATGAAPRPRPPAPGPQTSQRPTLGAVPTA